MSQVKKIGDTLPKNPITPIQKRNFSTDVVDVRFTLPVNSPCKKLHIELVLCSEYPDVSSLYYSFDYLPNVDINQYLQYVVNLYNNGVETYPPKSN